jgi:hypothetical protein
MVLDGDNHGAVRWLEANLPPTLTVISSPGKLHCYVQIPRGLKVMKKQYTKIGSGTLSAPEIRMDLQADGSYVAAPGTLHPKGHRYAIGRAVEPIVLDRPGLDALLERLEGEFGAETKRYRILYRFSGLRKGKPAEPGRLHERVRRLKHALASELVTVEDLESAAKEAGWGHEWGRVYAEAMAVPAPKPPREKRERRGGGGGGGGGHRWVEIAGSTIDELCLDMAGTPPGARNATLFETAMRARWLGFDSAEDRKRIGQAAFDGGLEDEEIERTLESAWRRPAGGAWASPVEEVKKPLPKDLLLFFAAARNVGESDTRALNRLLACSQYAVFFTGQKSGKHYGERRWRCRDRYCPLCQSREARIAARALERLWPETVRVLEGRDRGEVRAEAKRLGLPSPVVMDFGKGIALGVCPGGDTPREEAIALWCSERCAESKEWLALLHENAEGALDAWLAQRERKGDTRRWTRGELPSGFRQQDLALGLELLGAQKLDLSVEPMIATVVHVPTGAILATLPYVPTSLDLDGLVLAHLRC